VVVSVARWLPGLALLAGCGDNEPVCPIDALGARDYCPPAAVLALRETEHLVVQQDEVSYFYELQRPAYVALPILRMAGANTDSSNKPGSFLIQSDYPPILEAWNSGEIRVGEARVDRWFADAGAYFVERLAIDAPDGFQMFTVKYERWVSWRVLEQGLATIPDTRFDPEHYKPPTEPDVILEWDGDDAIFTFLVGWGDCIVQCFGTHHWQARVTPELEVTIDDLGGDPVPDWFQEIADQRPPPL
jgi:hypothetical protein